MFKARSYIVIFNFSKKDPTTRFALSRSLKKNGVGHRRFAEDVLCLSQLPDDVLCLSCFVESFAGYFSKSAAYFIYIVVLSTKKRQLKSSWD